jgi:hypothetical protein
MKVQECILRDRIHESEFLPPAQIPQLDNDSRKQCPQVEDGNEGTGTKPTILGALERRNSLVDYWCKNLAILCTA